MNIIRIIIQNTRLLLIKNEYPNNAPDNKIFIQLKETLFLKRRNINKKVTKINNVSLIKLPDIKIKTGKKAMIPAEINPSRGYPMITIIRRAIHIMPTHKNAWMISGII